MTLFVFTIFILFINLNHAYNHLNLYKTHEKWAVNQAILFKHKHKYKCFQRNIKLSELIYYSKIGLYKSTLNYNEKFNFMTYSKFYIHSELIKTLSDAFSLSPLPKKIRQLNKSNYTFKEKKHYKKLLQVTHDYSEFISNQYQTVKENDNNHYYEYLIYWIYINQLTAFQKRIVSLKYDFLFNKQLSNKKIGLLMGYSEEYIRKNLKIALEIVRKKVNNE
jgi:DNA-directed RNA polymerase sigma subunit (sigma70/sigma32)